MHTLHPRKNWCKLPNCYIMYKYYSACQIHQKVYSPHSSLCIWNNVPYVPVCYFWMEGDGGKEREGNGGRGLKGRTPYFLQTKFIRQWIYLDGKHTTISLSCLSLPSSFFPFLRLPPFSFPSLPLHLLLPFSSRMLLKHIFKLYSFFIFILVWAYDVLAY